ncbi:MAG: hypothetical protein B6D44_08780 [Ignavibacteriales bacterium UTCHB2]|jgi:hypothetical protein|nr:MAG: Pregnancy-associated plasma protein-A [Ignavibacteria bacterium ADurb.Bin266]OQY72932.1 MAG: hypothetical protein B6D44_08780 [Ignavibacteriales bacterium UTCHB2]HQI42282.1 zinc-dependent metalloprotease [Ignavibacteriaceae bacterium]HQJ45298.1 zinc-dependent metalloprotease [Ignavibacteriaceae bacterium]
MKKLFFLVLILFFIGITKAQVTDSLCASFPIENLEPLTLQKAPNYVNLSTVDWADIAVAIHIIRYSDGSGGFNPKQVLTIISNLDSAYSGAKMRFFLHTLNFIDDDQYAIIISGDEVEDQLANENNVGNAINIYVAENYGANGRATFTPDLMFELGDYRTTQSVIVRKDVALGSTTPHEVGHYFNLLHTFHQYGGKAECPDGSNSSIAGDLVTDTPAEPKDNEARINFDSNCHFKRAGASACGISYDTTALNQINANNLMSYAPLNCRIHFTYGQLARARTTLENERRSELLKKWVQFSNQINTENPGGSLLIDNTNTILSTQYKAFADNNIHTVKTNNEIFTNYNGSGINYKHNNWNDDLTNYKLSRNFSLPISFTKSQQTAKFLDLRPVNMNISGDIFPQINFQDPWYVEQDGTQPESWKSYTSPFTPGSGDFVSYGGLFLNQSDTTKAIYKIRIPSSMTLTPSGSIVDIYLLGWDITGASLQHSGSLTTGVAFTVSNGSVTAKVKGHLFTNSPTATASNNQRKIVQGSNGYWAMVYVSMDQVWLSRSTDGVNWEKEIKISSGLTANCPHISMSGNHANIVWQETNWQGGSGFDFTGIYLRSYNLIDNTLGQTIMVDSFVPISKNFQATPVIDGEWGPSYASVMLVWKEPDGLKIKRYTHLYGWSSKGTISGTNSYSTNPSIVDYNSSNFFICWEDAANHKIKYIEASYGTSWSFFSAADVSPSYWMDNMSPQMTLVSSNKPTIVWRSRNNIVEGLSVHIRQKSADVWQNITSFSQTGPFSPNPVIGDYYSQNKMDVLWDIGNSIYKASFNGSSWTGPTFLTSNGGTGLNINRTSTYQTKALWKKPDNTIVFQNIGGTAPPAKVTAGEENEITTLLYRLNRHAIIELPKDIDSTAKGSVCFEIAGISTLYNNSEKKINYSLDENNLLASEPFRVAAENIQLKFSGAIYGAGLDLKNDFISSITEPLAKVMLKDKKSNETLKDIWVNDPSMLNQIKNGTFGEFRDIFLDLNNYLGKTVYVQVEMIGESKNIKPLIVDDYLILKDSTSIAENLAKKNYTDYALPTEYTLMQNFPNPFNPNTTITFFLPEAQYTTLKIYNVLGKEVKTVVNENLKEGYHSVDINMSNEPSGVYLYSLSAGNFRETKKLLLLK